MIQYLTLLQEKRDLLLEAYKETEKDTTEIEVCITSVANNNSRFGALKKLQIRLSLCRKEGTKEEENLNEEILELLLKVKSNTSKRQVMLQGEKGLAASAISDFTQIRAITNSYVRVDQGPVFVDKDFK